MPKNQKSEPSLNVSFGLRKIQTDQFAIIPDAYNEAEVLKQKMMLEFSVDKENKFISVSPEFSLLSNDKTFLIIKGSFMYEIGNASWASFTTKKTTTIPLGFLRHITITSIGALRGILHAKTENTEFNEYFIPTINVEQIVTEDLIIR